MADTQVVFLGQKGEIRQGKLKDVSPESFAKALKKKEPPSLLGKSLWRQKQRTLYFFGYLDGKAGTENQHHLPTPLEGMTFYGDIMVAVSSSPTSYTTLLPLKTADYETFYTSNLEGEDDENSDGDGDSEDAGGVDEVVEEAEEDDDGGVGGGYDGDSDDDNDASASASASADEDGEGLALPAEKPVRATRARKAVVTAVFEEPEVEEVSSYDSSEHRIRVFNIIGETFTDRETNAIPLSDDDKIALEEVIYKRACATANYEEIRKSWNLQAFRDVYFATARRLIGNLNPSTYIKNKNLWERFAAKELTFEEIAKQNYYEMCPEHWQEMVDRQAKREKIQLEGDFSRATDKWTCNGCKKKKCTYYELQTRSADEPMTIFIHCLNCGKRWTQ
jgi:DNA-directed RNA polymerase subunit M/transcription elongation factor TFIIS